MANRELLKQEKRLDRIWVAVLSESVTRHGAWVAHPEIGGYGWSVTLAGAGLQAGSFSTRARAEKFALELSRRFPTLRTLKQWLRVPLTMRRGLARRAEEIREGK